MNDLTFDPAFTRDTLLALACGSVVGTERQLRGKAAGIRTCAMVAMGSYWFTTIGAHAAQVSGGDATRVLAQVVTGVGFLGAGMIIQTGSDVHGLSSAAVVWALAAIGAAIGLGEQPDAVAMTAFVLLVLLVTDGLERLFGALRRGIYERTDLPWLAPPKERELQGRDKPPAE